jgi:hypothetical protein
MGEKKGGGGGREEGGGLVGCAHCPSSIHPLPLPPLLPILLIVFFELVSCCWRLAGHPPQHSVAQSEEICGKKKTTTMTHNDEQKVEEEENAIILPSFPQRSFLFLPSSSSHPSSRFHHFLFYPNRVHSNSQEHQKK